MRLPPTLFEVALLLGLWVANMRILRLERARAATDPSPKAMQSYRLLAGGIISATVGVTWFLAWLITDTRGPQWLHTISVPATVVCIGLGAVLSGYAAWVRSP